jgi:predicted HAD superfamily Cof-like phosphohydrolase
MNESLQKVKKFHEVFNSPFHETPTIPSIERCKLRINLLTEELKELSEAIENKDMVEMLDALCDIQYVLNGSILEFGMAGLFDEAFAEVHDSNMTKTCKTEQEAQETIEHYKNNYGYSSTAEKVGDVWVVFRDLDKKVLKSINYVPADMKKFIQCN